MDAVEEAQLVADRHYSLCGATPRRRADRLSFVSQSFVSHSCYCDGRLTGERQEGLVQLRRLADLD